MAIWTCPEELAHVISSQSAARTLYACRHVAFDVLARELDVESVCMTAESESGETWAIFDRNTLEDSCADADCILVADRSGFRAPYRIALVS